MLKREALALKRDISKNYVPNNNQGMKKYAQ